jgi:hypothetical protein
LLAGRGIPTTTIQAKLVVIEGNVKDTDAVQQTLLDGSGHLVNQIVFGVGIANPLSSDIEIRLLTTMI